MVEMIAREMQIPDGVSVEVVGNIVKISGPKGTITKKLPLVKGVKIEMKDNKIVVSSEVDRRKYRAIVGALIAHIRNCIKGVQEGYTYKLKICFSHFPITVKVEKGRVIIQNFLGERKPRVAKIVGNAEVKIEGPIITVTGIDLDEVSQTAGNIEVATRIVGYDRRKFQDGIFIISKGD